MLESIINWDVSVLMFIQDNMRSDLLTAVMKFITSLGYHGILWIGLLIVLVFFKKTQKAALTAAVALAITFVIVNLLLKPEVARIRPYDAFPQIVPLVNKLTDFSFPSGHTANGFAVSLVLLRMLPKKYSVWLVVLNALIAFTRIYLGVHYPTDVIGGFLIALAVSQLVWYIADGRKKKPEPAVT